MRIFNSLPVWLGKHANQGLALLALSVLCVGVLLRTTHYTEVSVRSPDERLYTHFAQIIANEGLGGYRRIFADYAADPRQWIYPSPTRAGHVLLFAGVMKLTGSNSAQAGAAVSWTLSILSLGTLLWIGRRFFNRWVGVAAALFLATYVVDLEFARRAWGEATVSFSILVLFGLTCEVARRPRQWRWYAAFLAAGTLSLLIKETSFFAYALCGLWLVGVMVFKARDTLSAAVLVAGGLFSMLLAFAVLTALAGSPHLALLGLKSSVSAGSNVWGEQYASGPSYQYLYLLWLLGPLTLVMAGVGTWVVLGAPAARDDLGESLEPGWVQSASLAVLLTLGFISASSFGPNLQYMRIMAPANPTYCLLAGLGVSYFVARAPLVLKRPAYPLVLGLIPVLFVVVSWRDFSRYTDVVVRSGMQDLAARWIIDGVANRGKPVLASARRPLEPTAQATDLSRSAQYCQRGAFDDCVKSALTALQRDPTSPEAWNNAAAGYAGLGRWDDAIRCATEAVRLRPSFLLARNNLAWAVQQKAQESPVSN